MSAAKRGKCTECRYSFRLRKDGTVQQHYLYCGNDRHDAPCEGSGNPPVPYDPDKCFECMMYYQTTPGLMEAIWSVAIESPKSGGQLAWEFLESYHDSGHREAA